MERKFLYAIRSSKLTTFDINISANLGLKLKMCALFTCGPPLISFRFGHVVKNTGLCKSKFIVVSTQNRVYSCIVIY